MNALSIIAESSEKKEFLRDTLSEAFESNFIEFADLGKSAPGLCTLIDLDLSNVRYVPYLKKWLECRPDGAKVVFVVDKTSRAQAERAFAIGASDVAHRPVQSSELIAKLLGDVAALSDGPTSKAIREMPGAIAAMNGLRNMFSSATAGKHIDYNSVQSASGELVDQMEKKGLAAWINAIRTHHSQTYQRCLMVTGLLVAFGQRLNVSRSDRMRLSVAGMLYDIGKARVPVTILEKRGALTQEETEILRRHPQFGYDALKLTPGTAPEMLEVALHHHEYLDGSGYPHGIAAGEVSDLVRLVTIADVFAAMIEWRSHRAPMSCWAAYKTLMDMGPKLDQELVREFQGVAQLGEAR
jgi:response regulator RpfG family c-di-GMP phosphodiesterase